MADTRYFESTAVMPTVDFGAIYDNAVAKRQASEEREMQYMNQFKKVRGALTPGLKNLGQSMFNKIQDSLNEGDMSIDARKQRMQAYNDYQDVMATGVQYTDQLNKLESQVLSNVDKYNAPDSIIDQLNDLRSVEITDLPMLDNQVSTIPNLSAFKIYKAPMTSVNDAATSFRRTFNIDQFRDPTTGVINPSLLDEGVREGFLLEVLDDDDISEIIASQLRQDGQLTGTTADRQKVRSIQEDPVRSKQYVSKFAGNVSAQLQKMLNTDIETAAEKARAKEGSNIFQYGAVNEVTLRPARALKEGTNYVDPKKEAITSTRKDVQFLGNLTGTLPSYEDQQGVKKTIESGGLDRSGNPIVKITYDQTIKNTEGSFTNEKYKVTEIVPWSDIYDEGWNNEKQIGRLYETFKDMQSNFQPGMGGPMPGVAVPNFMESFVPSQDTPVTAEEEVGILPPKRPEDPLMPGDVDDVLPPSERIAYTPPSAMEQIFGRLAIDIPDASSRSDNTNPLQGTDPVLSQFEDEDTPSTVNLPAQVPEVRETEVRETEVVEADGKDRTLVEQQYEEQDKIKALPNTQEVYNEIQSVSEIVKELDTADLDFGDQVASSVTMMSPEALKDLVNRNQIDLGKYSVEEFQELVSTYMDEYPLFFEGMKLVQV